MKTPLFKDMILFEDQDLILVNKPPFLASLDERQTQGPNVLSLAKNYHPDTQVCHRLDRETSGLMVLAKNPETYRNISMQFERRKVKKIYHALLDGTHEFKDLEIDLPILQDNSGRVKIDRKEGKKANTFFNSLEYFKHFTLVEARPVTGRMHQIRIHLATQRACISGDLMYGGKIPYLSQIKRGYRPSREEEAESPMIRRFALHAYKIEFIHPNGELFRYEAPYPKDFSVFLKQLEKFDR
jgi:23S rRNA pseudouridine955/2504/2580 synthase